MKNKGSYILEPKKSKGLNMKDLLHAYISNVEHWDEVEHSRDCFLEYIKNNQVARCLIGASEDGLFDSLADYVSFLLTQLDYISGPALDRLIQNSGLKHIKEPPDHTVGLSGKDYLENLETFCLHLACWDETYKNIPYPNFCEEFFNAGY